MFIDDHISWDCTSPSCDIARGGEALYRLGGRMQWLGGAGASVSYFPYGYDPAGFGIELHWFNTPRNFSPTGTISPSCFFTFPENGTCAGVLKGDTPPVPLQPSPSPSPALSPPAMVIVIGIGGSALLILSVVLVIFVIKNIYLRNKRGLNNRNTDRDPVSSTSSANGYGSL